MMEPLSAAIPVFRLMFCRQTTIARPVKLTPADLNIDGMVGYLVILA